MDRRPGSTRTETAKREKLEYLKPFVVDEKMTAGQKKTVIDFNRMRERLLEIGEMESK